MLEQKNAACIFASGQVDEAGGSTETKKEKDKKDEKEAVGKVRLAFPIFKN